MNLLPTVVETETQPLPPKLRRVIQAWDVIERKFAREVMRRRVQEWCQGRRWAIVAERLRTEQAAAAYAEVIAAAKRKRIMATRLNVTLNRMRLDFGGGSYLPTPKPPAALTQQFPTITSESWHRLYRLRDGFIPVALHTMFPTTEEWADLYSEGELRATTTQKFYPATERQADAAAEKTAELRRAMLADPSNAELRDKYFKHFGLGYDSAAIITSLYQIPQTDRHKFGNPELSSDDATDDSEAGEFSNEGGKPKPQIRGRLYQGGASMLAAVRMQRMKTRATLPRNIGKRPATRKEIDLGISKMWALKRPHNRQLLLAIREVLLPPHEKCSTVAERRGLSAEKLQTYCDRVRRHARRLAKDEKIR